MKIRHLFLLCLIAISATLSANGKTVIPITTDDISLIYKVDDKNGRLYQSYLGQKLSFDSDIVQLPLGNEAYLTHGMEDYFEPAIRVLHNDGNPSLLLKYISHENKQLQPGVDETVILLKDDKYPVEVKLHFIAYPKENIIKEYAEISHQEKKPVTLYNYASSLLHLNGSKYFLTEFAGDWAHEVNMKETELAFGKKMLDTKLGSRANMFCSPFFLLALDRKAEENAGDVLFGTIGWTGNYRFTFEVDNENGLRVLSGINPYASEYSLKPNEVFRTPEFIFTYSTEGKGKASRDFQSWARKYQLKDGEKSRMTLLNNWEATYFDFNEDTIVEIAKSAKKAGIEMFVLDDGWFGTRNDDKQGLGDWFANLNKLEHGISGLSKRIEEECGMKFGLWFEPEMVNENSDLFRKHSDYRIETPGRKCSHGRNEFVLDFSRKEVVDCIYDQMEKLLADSKVSYIKWDMNRSITECFSKGWAANKQGEIFHRYILGVYDLYERLTKRFPEILFESCASGGGRFDPGMLYYAPQTWTSDDSDAIERIKIQYGTSMVYPLSSMGAHVSVTPNHQLFRNTPLSTRANVAYFGAFGYELNIAKLSEEEQEEIKKQVEFVKQYRGLIQKGRFYRLLSPFEGNIAAWIVVSEDKKDAIMGYYKILNDVNCPYRRLCLHGLDEKMEYTIEGVDGVYSGRELMKAGMITSDPSAGQVLDGGETCTDFWSKIYLLHGEK